MMLNKLDFSTIGPCLKVLQTTSTLNTWICLYFCINKDNIDVNGLFPFHLVFYELDIYALKWLCKMYAEMSPWDMNPPPAVQWWGSSPPPPPPPQHSQKLASMHWEMKRHGSRVNLWVALHVPQDLHLTRVLWFPNINKKVYFNP